MPPTRAPRRLALIIGGALTALFLLCGTGAVGITLLVHADGHEDADRAAIADAARNWATALPGVRLDLWLADEDGQRTHGRLTVTAGGDAAGTLTQPGGGTASLRAHDGITALDGDRTWQARAADATDAVTSAPDRPTIDVTGSFAPDRLAATVASAVANAQAVEPVGEVNGQKLVSYSDGSWTLYLTASAPHAMVYLEGPVAPGLPVAPAAAPSPSGLVLVGPPPVAATTATVVPADNEYRNPYVAAAITPATPAQAADAAATARGGTPSARPARPARRGKATRRPAAPHRLRVQRHPHPTRPARPGLRGQRRSP